MSGVCGGSHGDGNDAVFLVRGANGDVLGGPSAGANHVGILPELKEVVREVIIGHASVPRRFVHVCGPVVTGRDDVELGVVAQVLIGLGGGKGGVALLEGNAGNQLRRVGVGRRVKIQDVYQPVAMAPRLKAAAGFSLRNVFCSNFRSGKSSS